MKNIKEEKISNKRFLLKSLDDIWYLLIVIIVQSLCIHKGWLNLIKYNRQSWQPNQKPNAQIYLYIFCLMANICLLPLYVFTSMFKIGSHANDHFKFGFDLDSSDSKTEISSFNNNSMLKPSKNRIKKSSSNHLIASENKFRPNINSNVSNKLDQASSTSFISNHSSNNFKSNTKKTKSFSSFLKTIIKYLLENMPISNLIHLIMSFCLILPNILMISKEIEYGLRPKGNLYHTELDFLFSRPLKRFSESISISFDTSTLLLNKNLVFKQNENSYHQSIISNNKLKYQLIASSLDDITEINYTPSISLELFNYLLALTLFSIQYSVRLINFELTFILKYSISFTIRF
jgi:hypothetical protein